jgi:hypothetical protein
MAHAVGLANNLMLFFVSIAAAALLLAVLNDPFQSIAAASTASSPQAQQGQAFIQTYWDALPFVVVFLGLIQLVGAAAVEAKTP